LFGHEKTSFFVIVSQEEKIINPKEPIVGKGCLYEISVKILRQKLQREDFCVILAINIEESR